MNFFEFWFMSRMGNENRYPVKSLLYNIVLKHCILDH